MAAVIKFENVSKRYRLGSGRGSLREAISNLPRRLVGKSSNPDDDASYIWALKDVSFEVEQGEALGIIGPNGAGKTTILKLLARITKQTSGNISVNGRVGSLIELGAGFHPDLTGRENIYLNGAILGLSRKEIDRKFDSIVDFSGLEKFIDTPVKRYSSGMFVRLGFSVAAHVDPDILLLDEVLAVGDIVFQGKCLRLLAEKRESTSTVFVSHNMDIVRKFCSRILVLDHGHPIFLGAPDKAIDYYLCTVSTSKQTETEGEDARAPAVPIYIRDVHLLDGSGNWREVFQSGEDMIVDISYVARQPVSRPIIAYSVVDPYDTICLAANTLELGIVIPRVEGTGHFRFYLSKVNLNSGTYLLSVAIHDARSAVAHYDLHYRRYQFEVRATGRPPRGLLSVEHFWESSCAWTWAEDSPTSNSDEDLEQRYGHRCCV